MKEGYKESALGLIPKSWAVTNIGDVATKVQDGNYGASYPKSNEFLAEGVPFLTSSTISSNIVNFDKLKYISEIKHIELKKAHIKENDVILTNRGANIGKCAITTPSLEDANIGPQVTLIRCKKDYDYNLLHQVIMSSIIQKQIANINSGSAMNFLSLKVTNALQIPFPPLPEQQKIAEILSTVDAKIEIIDQQISETQELKKGLMQQLLTKGIGHTDFKDSALGEIPKSWEVVKIGDVMKLGGGKDYKHLNEGNFPVYGTGGIMTYVDEYLYEGESVGIGRKGTIDKPVFLKGKFWTVDTLFYTHSFTNVIPFFVYVVFQSINWRKYSEATGVPSLSRRIIEPIEIPLPSIEEQSKIVDVFQSVWGKLEVLSEKKATYQELKQGLMQQLLTGKVRV